MPTHGSFPTRPEAVGRGSRDKTGMGEQDQDGGLARWETVRVSQADMRQVGREGPREAAGKGAGKLTSSKLVELTSDSPHWNGDTAWTFPSALTVGDAALHRGAHGWHPSWLSCAWRGDRSPEGPESLRGVGGGSDSACWAEGLELRVGFCPQCPGLGQFQELTCDRS